MAVSEITICNLALTRLGYPVIVSLDEDSQEARYCNQLYESSRDAVLRDYDWNFATKRVSIPNVTLPEEYMEYEYAYAYPSDCVKARSILDSGGNKSDFEVATYLEAGYSRKGILTNIENAVLVYTKKVEDTGIFDPAFVEAFSYKLAADLAWPLIREHDAETIMLQKYAASMPSAMDLDAQEGKRDPLPTDSWINARFGLENYTE